MEIQNNITVLVVDDNFINRQYFSMSLSKSGYDVVLAENGFEAVAQTQENDFDIILIDIRMPEMDGYEATSLIKSLDRHKNTPIIATSAESIDSDKISLFNDFLLKPISPTQLQDIVEKYCSNPDNKTFNQESALKFAYHDKAIMQKLLVMFVDDLPKQMSVLATAIGNNNAELSSNIIHKIRGSCKACGADDLDTKLQELAHVIKLNNSHDINKGFYQLEVAKNNYIEIIAQSIKQ